VVVKYGLMEISFKPFISPLKPLLTLLNDSHLLVTLIFIYLLFLFIFFSPRVDI